MTGLRSNYYRMYFQDATGCEGYTDSIFIGNPTPITTSFTTTSPVCANTSTATVTVNATGGTPPYQYKNGANGTYQSSNVFTGLLPNVTYRMYVQDANGCIGYTTLINIAPTSPISVTTAQSNVTCKGGKDGSITVFASNGTPPYQYKNGVPGALQTSSVFNNLIANQYRIYVYDANGCRGNSSLVFITQPTTACFGSFAKETVAASGPNTGLAVALSPNPTSSQFVLTTHNISNKVVTIRVIDVNGKTQFATKGQTEQTFRFGSSLAPGIYLVEVRQGDEVKTLKAIKN